MCETSGPTFLRSGWWREGLDEHLRAARRRSPDRVPAARSDAGREGVVGLGADLGASPLVDAIAMHGLDCPGRGPGGIGPPHPHGSGRPDGADHQYQAIGDRPEITGHGGHYHETEYPEGRERRLHVLVAHMAKHMAVRGVRAVSKDTLASPQSRIRCDTADLFRR
jgi:hypothetical protein